MEERLLALLRLAIITKASDIHFIVKEGKMNILMRIDGENRKIKIMPGDKKLIRYLQYLANLDVGQLNIPQTGQFEIEVDNSLLSLRFAFVRSLKLVSGVLRILNNNLKIDGNRLSNNDSQNIFFKNLLNMRNGLVLFSGPTGSGKTTTLYSLLNTKKDKIIYTIEDPIEIYNDNFIQVQINEKQNLDYEEGIKQIMRHDPDIIMIGEIRDKKAATMAIRAANTGHLVLATIHASSASSCISRMIDLGANENHLYEMLLCSINQRMIIKKGEKQVVYEIMDKKEIEYYSINHCNSNSFISIEKQINRGIEDGTIKLIK